MKEKNGAGASITQPLLKDLIDRHKLEANKIFDQPAGIGETPLDPPALYQDPGQGYNSNFVFPQE